MGAGRRHRRESRQARLAAMASGMRGRAQLVRGEWLLRMSPAHRQDDDGCDGIIAPQYARQSAPPHQDAAVHGAGWRSWLRCQASRKCRVLRRQPWDQESRSGGKAATRRVASLARIDVASIQDVLSLRQIDVGLGHQDHAGVDERCYLLALDDADQRLHA